MILDLKNNMIDLKIKLTDIEAKVIGLLSNQEINTREQLEKFVYGDKKVSVIAIPIVIYRLRKKGFNIKNNRYGYFLEDDICIE